jgi:hypothetical protein
VKVLVLVDVVLLVLAVGAWTALHEDATDGNAANPGLRGSLPPAGARMPDLSGITGIEPPMPAPNELRGQAVALAATCMECRSGDVLGGFLGRMVADDVPRGATLLVLGWDGDPAAWTREWRIGAGDLHPDVHVARTKAAADEVRQRLGIGSVDGAEESGITFLYDRSGRWRSTYFLGQLDRDDIRHDLRVLAR